MIQLASGLSAPLLTLIEQGEAPIDAVEVGPWLSLRQVRTYRAKLTRYPFHYHASNLIALIGLVPGSLRRIRAYAEATQCPWVSVHLSSYPPGFFWFYQRFGVVLPGLGPDRTLKRLRRQVGKIRQATDLPVLLENMPILPKLGPTPEIDPDFITEVITEVDCGMLLDTAHAQVAAAAIDLDSREYIQRLPLDRVVEIHASGPGTDGGRLVDAHNPLQERDYRLLEWLLGKSQPGTLTLEYFKTTPELKVQLHRLRDMLA